MDAVAEKPEKQKRRVRWERQSTGRRVTPGAREAVWFQKLWEHGPLPTTYLYEYTKDITPSKDVVQHRLTDLFHEDNTPHGGEYLWRPEEQWRLPKHKEEIHENDAAAEEFLRERGLISHASLPSKKTNTPHRYMEACITASIELACRDAGLGFLSSQELLTRAPSGSLEIPLTISYQGHTSQKSLVPDGYFELKYGDAGYRAFLLEADRENEPVKSNNLDRTSYLRKLLQYRQLIGTGRYKEHFGIRAGMLVLTVTTSFAHMDSIIALLMKLTDGRGAPYMLFKAYPAFAGRNIAAQPVLSELLTTPWRRAGFPDIDISKP